MSTTSKKLAIVSIFLASLSLSTGSFANDWVSEPLVQEGDEQVFAKTSETTAISFICIQGKLRAAIATQGEEGSEVLNSYNETRRRINRDVLLSIDNEVKNEASWMINPMKEIYVTPSRSEAAKIYNAAVSQKAISIQRKGKEKIDLRLPTPNDSFAKFGSNCGIGINAKKQS